MEEKIKALLNAARTKDIAVLDKALPDATPCITFHFFGETGVLFGAGKATEEMASCQIDIWYKVKTDSVKTTINNIRKAIKEEKYFTYPELDNNYDNINKVWHSYFVFNLIKESEE